MMNITKNMNLSSNKSFEIPQLKAQINKNDQCFSQILNKEKQNQQPRKDIRPNITRDKIENTYKKEKPEKTSQVKASSPENKDKVKVDNKANENSTTEEVENVKTQEKETSKIEKDSKDIKNQKTQEKIEDEETLGDTDLLSIEQMLSMLQSLIETIETSSEDLEDINLRDDLMVDLVDLEKLLNSLLETVETVEIDQDLKVKIEEFMVDLKNLRDLNLQDKDLSSLISTEQVIELLTSLEEVKESLLGIAEDSQLKKQSMDIAGVEINKDPIHKKIEKDTKETQALEEDKTSEVEAKEDPEIKTQVKSQTNDFNKDIHDHENKDSLGDSKTNQDIIFDENTVNTQQNNILDNNIFVNTEKNQIVNPTQFIKEVAQKASAFLSKDRNEMNIQLSPASLGKISIKIGINDGSLTGKIYAENFSVKEIIESNLDQLRDSLEEQGLSIAGLEVEVGDNSSNFNRQLYESNKRKRQFKSNTSQNINRNFIAANFEQESINKQNPYLVSNSFEGLV